MFEATRRVLFVVCVSACVSACGADKPDVDEKTLLDTVNFYQPISVSVDINQIFDSGTHFRYPDAGSLIALFTKAGLLKEVPVTNEAPWWGFVTSGGTLSGTTFTVPVATRVVTGHSDERSWTEGSVKYYAETISYSIQPTDAIEAAAHPTFADGKLRLVVMNDPAVGKWQVVTGSERGTSYYDNDPPAVLQRLIPTGQPFVSDFLVAVSAAQQQAYATIEQNLISQGTLAHSDKDRFLIRSPANHLVFYAEPIQVTHSLADIQRYCRALIVGGYAGYHIPSQTEMATVIDSQGDQFIDTPDGRFWGATGINRSDPGGTVLFATNTYSANFGTDTFALDLETLVDVQHYSYYYNMHTYRIEPNGQMARVNVVYDVAASQPIAAHDYPNARWRVLCVASVP